MNNLPKIHCDVIEGPDGIKIYHSGPSLDHGPLPTFFYFALSGEESLTLDPFNQPVSFLRQKNSQMRVFSITLPGHHPHEERAQAMNVWGSSLVSDGKLLIDFLEDLTNVLDFLILRNWIDVKKIGAGGLSRGAFIATHFAAKDSRISTILGFSPLTDLGHLSDIKESSDRVLLDRFSLVHLVDLLADRKIRFYIGNRDTRVGTRACLNFIEALTEAAYQHNHRSLPIECHIFPSIGHKGHGTPPEIFFSGAQWLEDILAK